MRVAISAYFTTAVTIEDYTPYKINRQRRRAAASVTRARAVTARKADEWAEFGGFLAGHAQLCREQWHKRIIRILDVIFFRAGTSCPLTSGNYV
jgi:hypothetical protein